MYIFKLSRYLLWIIFLSLKMLNYARDHQMKDDEGILIEGEHYEQLKKDIEEQRDHY